MCGHIMIKLTRPLPVSCSLRTWLETPRMTFHQSGKGEAPRSSASVTVGVAVWRLANIRVDAPPSGPRVRRKRVLKQLCERKSGYFFEGGTTRVPQLSNGSPPLKTSLFFCMCKASCCTSWFCRRVEPYCGIHCLWQCAHQWAIGCLFSVITTTMRGSSTWK